MRRFDLHNEKNLAQAEPQGTFCDSNSLGNNRAFNNRRNYFIVI